MTSLPVREEGQHPVVFTQHFTSGPPLSQQQTSTALVRHQGGVADVDGVIEKQEEWIKKRKVEQVTTKQIETRVKRQVVVTEDGEVVDDSGPQVTTNTHEDTETKQEEHTEKKGGDGDGTMMTALMPPKGWVAVPGATIIREKHEIKSNTRDQTDERLETEQVHQLGNISHEALEDALELQRETGQSILAALPDAFNGQESNSQSSSSQRQLVPVYSSPKRIVHQSRKHKRTVDQENTEERSEEKDGRITTETTKHEHHESIDDDEAPDDDFGEGTAVDQVDGKRSDTSSIREIVKETRNHYSTIKDEDQVEYIAVPKGGHVSGGVPLGRGPRKTSRQQIQYDDSGHPVAIPAEAAIIQQQPQPQVDLVGTIGLATVAPAVAPEVTAERTDALTKKPLDLEAEEETRKLETSRWLESHFGSESGASSSAGSTSNKKRRDKEKMPSQQHVSSGGINVTMMSDPPGSSSGDRYDAPTIPAPPPPPMAGVNESRIYARPEPIQQQQPPKMSFANRFAPAGSPYERVQVLPVGPEKLFGRVVSPPPPPQSPTYKSSSGYQSGMHNGGGGVAPAVSKPEYQRNLSADSHVKRSTSFNQHSTSPYYGSLQNPRYNRMSTSREEINTSQYKQSALSARQTFLNSLNSTNDYNNQQNNTTLAADRKAEQLPTYSTPIVKRWPPPPKQVDDDDENENDIGYIHTSTPKGGTVIRLGPTPVNRIERTQSMNTHQSSTPRMNMINSSLQSVPEREKQYPQYKQQQQQQQPQEYHRKKTPPQPLGFFIDTDRSFRGMSPVRTTGEETTGGGKVVQTYYAKTSPPPRPAPPVSNRTSESFRMPRTAPMFSDQLTSPPVRPVRRNKSVLSKKTDSGTQTMRKEIISQTLDRPASKPMKQYYMGEDPFAAQKVNGWVTGGSNNTNPKGPSYQQQQQQEAPQRPGRTEVIRSQTMPRRPSRPLQESSSYSSVQQQNVSNVSNLSSSRVFSDHDRSMNDTTASQDLHYRSSVIANVNNNSAVSNSNSYKPTPVKTSTTPVSITATPAVSSTPSAGLSKNSNLVNRSQSFQQQPAPTSLGHRNSLTSASSIRRMSNLGLGSMNATSKTSSPLYKSTSFLNRIDHSNSNPPAFSSLKSPGIVTSISKSQLELNKSNTELNMFGRSTLQKSSNSTAPNTLDANSALYTLPRRHSRSRITPEKTIITPPPPMPATPTNTPTSPTVKTVTPSDSVSRGESFSSMHRRRMQQEAQQQQHQTSSSEQMNFNASTKATHRSFRTIDEETTNTSPNTTNANAEADPAHKSLKERIALLESAGGMYASDTNPTQTLPRVVAGKTKGPPPPPPPRVSSAKKTVDELASPEEGDKKQKFLEGLLNTAPELFMHIHGDENLKGINVQREDVIDGRSNRRPSPPSNSNRMFTSSPHASAPMTPPPMLIRHPATEALVAASGTSRRGSLTSTGSAGIIIPAVKIPAPVNYSETVRIKSNQDPDSQSDSVQSYSKRVQPFVDGFSAETNHSSQQTTHTRSQYTTSNALHQADHYDSPSNSIPYSIRPQQSGGVIITVRGNGSQ